MSGLLKSVSLAVRDPEALATFYCDILGMRRMDQDGLIAVGYGGQEYWKCYDTVATSSSAMEDQEAESDLD